MVIAEVNGAGDAYWKGLCARGEEEFQGVSVRSRRWV